MSRKLTARTRCEEVSSEGSPEEGAQKDVSGSRRGGAGSPGREQLVQAWKRFKSSGVFIRELYFSMAGINRVLTFLYSKLTSSYSSPQDILSQCGS